MYLLKHILNPVIRYKTFMAQRKRIVTITMIVQKKKWQIARDKIIHL